MIPIIWGHNYDSLPVGCLDEDGTIRLLEESGVTVEQLANLEIGYAPIKVVDGVVVEAKLLELSLVVKQ